MAISWIFSFFPEVFLFSDLYISLFHFSTLHRNFTSAVSNLLSSLLAHVHMPAEADMKTAINHKSMSTVYELISELVEVISQCSVHVSFRTVPMCEAVSE
jgi:hypothetical protein